MSTRLRGIVGGTIASRVYLLVAFSLLCFVALSFASARVLETRLMAERSTKVRETVKLAEAAVAHAASLAETGKVSVAEAQRAALETVRAIHGDAQQYVWIQDLNTIMLMHPIKPEMVGKDLTDSKGPDGTKVFTKFTEVVRASPEGGGFLEYRWPKGTSSEAVRKLSYVKLYAPWGWILGSGLYLDDLEEAVAVEMRRLLVGSLVLALVLVAAGYLTARSVRLVVQRISQQAARLSVAVAEGRLDERGDAEQVSREFRPIVTGMNDTMDTFVRPIRVTSDYVARIANNEIPPAITDEYRGEFGKMKESLNRCIAAVTQLDADADTLAMAVAEGRLSTRIDASRHSGTFRKVAEAVNRSLESFASPMEQVQRALRRLADRDLTARMTGEYRGDYAGVKETLNGTAESLHASMVQVAEAVEQVSSASGQIASSSQAVASGASEQAASLEETSASLESMASMTKQAADSAQQADGLAQGARTAATEGSAAMAQMTSAMGKIKTSAEGTSQIIKDINEIAFQTNLLALNAAVEAARAGEAGRGFAVVAEEVRSLALRSKEAANKTEELIRQSVKEAGEGEVTAKHVSEKLADIAGSVTKVSGIIAEIAATAKEQTVGIDQVTKAVMQMNQVTQQNAASSEESSSAAAELSGQSEELAAMVGTFQLERSATVAKVTSKYADAVARRSMKPSAKVIKLANGQANG